MEFSKNIRLPIVFVLLVMFEELKLSIILLKLIFDNEKKYNEKLDKIKM
tara:strand:+ start:227 stop:373 length:147 start_codon:yes stop_codon:yes gene_type:complete